LHDCPVLTQDHYRWYNDDGAVCANTAKAAADTAITGVVGNDVLRLIIQVSETAGVAIDVEAQVEYSTDQATWIVVPVTATTEAFEMYDSTYATTCDATTTAKAGTPAYTWTNGHYFDNVNPDTTSVTLAGQTTEFEVCLRVHPDNAAENTTYYFRLTDAGTEFNTYSVYATLTTGVWKAAPSRNQKIYRWYENIDDVTPTTPLAAENTAITGVADGTVLRLRIGCSNDGTAVWTGEQFILQYDTDPAFPAPTDVDVVGGTGIWRYYDNPTPVDGTALPTLLLTGSNVAEHYCESDPTPVMADIAVNSQGEWDFVIQNNGAAGGVTYYFRLIRGTGEAFETYTSIPQLTTEAVYEWYDRGGIKLWEPGKYSNVTAIYFEATLRTSDASLEAGARLYNVTDGAPLDASLVETLSTTFVRVRSSNIQANMPTTDAEFRVQVGRKGTATAYCRDAEIVVVQST
jgi:hypothetical protein